MRLFVCLFLASAALAGDLKIDNVHLSDSLYGPTMQGSQFVPGSRIVARFDVVGLKDEKGVQKFSLTFGLDDAKGESVVNKKGEPTEGRDIFGRGALEGVVHIDLGPAMALGKFTLKLHVEDVLAGAAADKEVPLEVVEATFRAVGPRLAFDKEGSQEHGPEVTDGEDLYLVFHLVGLAEKDGKSHVQVDLVILDEAGKVASSLPNLIEGEVKAPDGTLLVHILTHITGKGKFTLKAIARDTVGKKETRVIYPLEIHPLR